MNTFVNPKKRSVSLPSGCTDLVEVIGLSERNAKAGRRLCLRWFIHSLLYHVQQTGVTELVIAGESPEAGKQIKAKFGGEWRNLPVPGADGHYRSEMVAELARMAKLPEREFPSEGVLNEVFQLVHLRWTVAMSSADGDCRLTRVQ
jgi:hypothetical protein